MARFWQDLGFLNNLDITDKFLVGKNSDGSSVYTDLQTVYNKISQVYFADAKPSVIAAGSVLTNPNSLTCYIAPAGSYTLPSGNITLTGNINFFFWDFASGWTWQSLYLFSSDFIFSPATPDAIQISGNTITLKNINVVRENSKVITGLNQTYTFTINEEYGYIKAKNISLVEGGNIMTLEKGIIPEGQSNAFFFHEFPMSKTEAILLYRYNNIWMSSYPEVQAKLDEIQTDNKLKGLNFFIFSPSTPDAIQISGNTITLKNINVVRENSKVITGLNQTYTFTINEAYGYIKAKNISLVEGGNIMTLEKGIIPEGQSNAFFFHEFPMSKTEAILLYRYNNIWMSSYPEVQAKLDEIQFSKKYDKRLWNNYHIIGDGKIVFSGKVITIPPIRRKNNEGGWDELLSSQTFDLSGNYSYVKISKSGYISGTTGNLVAQIGTNSFYWQEQTDLNIDVLIYNDSGLLKSDSPELQGQIDYYYKNNSVSESVQAYDMGVLFDSSNSWDQPRLFCNNQRVLKSGILTYFNVKTTYSGAGYIVVLREGVSKFLEEYSRTEIKIEGGTNNNIKGLKIPVKKGDFIGFVNKDCTNGGQSMCGKVENNGIGRFDSDLITNINNKITVTNTYPVLFDITFQYTYKVVETASINGDFEESKIVGIGNYMDGSNTFIQSGWATHLGKTADNGIVDYIKIKSQRLGTLTFGVGIIDQWGKVIIRKSFQLQVSAGINVKKVNYDIKKDEYLFVKLDGNNSNITASFVWRSHTDGAGTGFWYSDNENAALQNIGSSGSLPFTYHVNIQTSRFAYDFDLQTVSQQVQSLKSIVDSQIVRIKSPNGNEYLLQVDNSGNLFTQLSTVSKWIALGNSITKHPITTFWWGLWGMAASERSKDWVNQFQNLIINKQGNTPSFNYYNVASWEVNRSIDKSQFNNLFAGDESLVVIRLGENIQGDLTNLQSEFDSFIKYVKSRAINARIIVTGCFWDSTIKDNAIRNAAIANNCTYVSLADLGNIQSNRSTVDTLVYGDDNQWHRIGDGYNADGNSISIGVAAHPSDAGMLAIAQRIFSVL